MKLAFSVICWKYAFILNFQVILDTKVEKCIKWSLVDFDNYRVDDNLYTNNSDMDQHAILSSLQDMEDNMKYNDATQLYAYAVHGLGLEHDHLEEHHRFLNGVHNITSDFCNNGNPFDKSRPCIICGKTGHNFDGCEDL